MMQNTVLLRLIAKLGKGFPLAVLLALFMVGVALALTLTSADGIWSNATGDGGTPTCRVYLNTADTTDENQVRYGDDEWDWGEVNCPSDTDLQSGFGYDGVESLVVTPGDVFLLGEFTHYNRPIYIYSNHNFKQADLTIALNFIEPTISSSLEYTVQLDETTNQTPCAYPGSTICPDKVDLSDTIPDQTFGPIDGKYYKLQIIGFAPGTADTCEYVPGQTINLFYTEENAENNACLFARMLVQEPAIDIVKSPDPQYITTGSDAVFNMAVSNIGNVALQSVEVADALTGDCVRTGVWDGDTLAIGETITYTCTAFWPVVNGFVNTAVVTGHPVDDPEITVTDTDDAIVYVQDSQITIIKDVVDEDLLDWWHHRDFPFTTASTGSVITSTFALDDDCDPGIAGCPVDPVEGHDGYLQEKITFTGLVRGDYTFTETIPPTTTWVLAPQEGLPMGIGCTAVEIVSGNPITPTVSITNVSPYTTGNVAISLEANQHVTCTFTNKPGPGGTAVTLSDMQARAKSDFVLAGSALALGATLLLGVVITRKKRSF